jgi:hypothetical protein
MTPPPQKLLYPLNINPEENSSPKIRLRCGLGSLDQIESINKREKCPKQSSILMKNILKPKEDPVEPI